MQHIAIKIQSVQDANEGKPLIDGLTKDNIVEAERMTVGILEKGTEGGQTVLMFLQHLEGTNKVVCFQATARLFQGLYGVFQGAQLRFGVIQETERDIIKDLIFALEDAKKTIRNWHDMNGKTHGDIDAWGIYDQNSPEMKRINTALNRATEFVVTSNKQ